MAEVFTRDKIIFKGMRIEWENGGDARLIVDYTKVTATREIPVDRSLRIPLNATRQSQANMIRDLATAFVLTQEQATEFS